MIYDYDQHTHGGEQHLATAAELEQAGFTVHDAPEHPTDGHDSNRLDWLFDGGPDLETKEGVERALGYTHADRA